MPNKNYLKGRRKEYKIVNEARSKGLTSFRSAGSHSPIDVITIDEKNKIIRLIQCKPDSISEKAKGDLWFSLTRFNGEYHVYAEVL